MPAEMGWVYDLILEVGTSKVSKVVATTFHPQAELVGTRAEYHEACALRIARELGEEGNRIVASIMFKTLQEAQASWYLTVKDMEFTKGLD